MKQSLSMLKIGWQCSKKYFVFSFALFALEILKMVCDLVIPSLVLFCFGDKKAIYYLVIAFIGKACIAIGIEMIISYLESLENLLEVNFEKKIASSCYEMDYEKIEQSSTQDKIETAFWGYMAIGGISGFVNRIFEILIQVISLLGLITLFSNYSLMSLGIALIFLGIRVYIYYRKEKYSFTAGQNHMKTERMFSSFFKMMNFGESMKETKVFQAKDLLLKRYYELLQKIELNTSQQNKIGLIFDIVMIGLDQILKIVLMYPFIIAFIQNKMGISELLFYFNASMMLSMLLVQLLTSVNKLQWCQRYFGLFTDLIKENENEVKIKINKLESIEFKDVSFRYQNTTRDALSHVSFKIEGNQNISIVGENGCGKSTLIKVLLGLYQPTSGQVYVNGIDLKDIDKKSYYEHIGTVFQDFTIFADTVKNNIVFDEESDVEIIPLLEFVNDLPQKWESVLSKQFDQDGIELSKGQAQRVACRRAMNKEGLIILDEPASALDVTQETMIYEQIQQAKKESMRISISHRLASCIQSDVIFVMKQGSIIEQGTHHGLLENKKNYFDMFELQKNFFS